MRKPAKFVFVEEEARRGSFLPQAQDNDDLNTVSMTAAMATHINKSINFYR
jgi:hypothetical protein